MISYQTLKALHLVFVISWFAGLFYIFRLFVYHLQNWEHPHTRSVICLMERRLIRYIMLPAAVGSLGFGLALLSSNNSLLHTGWIWAKLSFVLLLFIYHGLAWWTHIEMKHGRAIFSERACRAINEIPTIALIAISLLVFLKPF